MTGSAPTPSFSRRMLVGSAMAAGAGVYFASVGESAPASAATPKAAAPSRSTGHLSIDATFPLSLLATTARSSYEIQVPARMTIDWPVSWGRDVAVMVTYDPRCLTFGSIVLSTIGAKRVRGETTVVSSATMSTAQFQISLPPTSETQSIEVVIPFSTRASFPNDAFGPGQPVAITVMDASDHTHVLAGGSSAAKPTDVSAWGVQLFAVWDSVSAQEKGIAEQRKYEFAQAIQVVSVGPAPTPADLSLLVSVDPKLVESYTLEGRTLNGTELTAGLTNSAQSSDQSSLLIPVGRPLKAGDTLMVDLLPSVRKGNTGIRGIRNFTATVQSAPALGSWQRVTGGETVTSVSASGKGKHSNQLLGTI